MKRFCAVVIVILLGIGMILSLVPGLAGGF